MDRRHGLIRAGALVAVALAAGHLAQRAFLDEAPTPATGAAAADRPIRVEPVAAVLPPATRPPGVPAPGPALAETAAPPPLVPGGDGAGMAAASGSRSGHADGDGAAPAALPPSTAPGPAGGTSGVTLAALTPPEGAAIAAPGGPVPTAEADAGCPASLGLAAGPMAMIALDLHAPCLAGARAVIRHAGLAVAETLDDRGRLALDLPALDARGQVTVLLPGGPELRDSVAMPSVARLRRLAVQWIADDAFQLHGMEGGAGYGEPGDVFAGNPASPAGGYLVTLGDPASSLPMMAEIYTWPAGVTVRPVIEAAVTEATCGRELMGETLLADRGTVTATDLTLAMPDCDAVGDILVLNNLIGESRLAAAEH